MGFADYFSRYPNSAAPPISENDTNYVINIMRISTNKKATKASTRNDVIS